MVKVSKNVLSALVVAVWASAGCGQSKPEPSGPIQGTLKLDNLPIDEQIKKVQEDPTIPQQYKETYINSLKAKAGQS